MPLTAISDISLSSCALCGSTSELILSHIIPKFVFRRLIKTSVGKLRSGENPNVTTQDGEKHKMLCYNCEQLFSGFEREFATNIFYPFQDRQQKSFKYGEWLQKFVVSVSWRSLYIDLIDFVSNHIGSIDAINRLVECEKIMREFLLGERSDVSFIENHIFFADEIDNASEEFIKLRPHMNLFRSATSYTTIIEANQAHYTYTNLTGILLFTLYGRLDDEEWTNTQVFPSGIIEGKKQIIRSHSADEIRQALEEAERIRAAISENQQKIINQRYEAVTGSTQHYPIFDLAEKDKKLRQNSQTDNT